MGREAPELGGFILSGGEQGGGGGARRRLLQGGEDEAERDFVEGRRGEGGESLQTKAGAGPGGSGQLCQGGCKSRPAGCGKLAQNIEHEGHAAGGSFFQQPGEG